MSKDKSPHVAVLVDTSTGWGRRLIRGIIRYSDKHGPWHLSVQPGGQADYFPLPHGWKGHGIIARIGSTRMVRAMRAARVHVVNVSAIDVPDNPFPQVITDYYEQAKIAVQHFRDRGFCHFAYCGLQRPTYGKRHRDAFREAVTAAGFRCDVYEPKRSSATADGQVRKLRQVIAWLKRLPKPVGIFTWATDVGREILEACRVAEISVPYEVAVLGGDFDELLCDASSPPLSGILVPSEQVGHDAAQILDKMMKRGRPPSRPVLVPPTGVVEKRSTDTLAIEDPDVAQVLTFIRANACQSIQVTDILRAVPLSRRSIERRFAEVLGRTPSDEIRRVRMAKARTLLAETSMSIEAIADACGYGTYNYLTRVFTKENRITPREYRKRVQGR